jgi:hypothetical protein
MKKALFILYAFLSVGLFAQQSFLSLEWENDGFSWFSGQNDNDKWFTNGIRLKYGAPVLIVKNTIEEAEKRNDRAADEDKIDLSKLENYDYVDIGGNLALRSEPYADCFKLGDSLSASFADSSFWMVFEVAQNMYTPADLKLDGPQYDDRPYAGWSRVGWSLYRQSASSMRSFGIDIGMLGEAGVGVTQTLIHYMVPLAEHPMGWDTHVKDRFAFQAHFSEQKDYFDPKTRWPGMRQFYWYSFSSSYEVQLGNVQIGALYKPLWRFGYFKESSVVSPTPSIPPIPKVIGDRSQSKAPKDLAIIPPKEEESWIEAFLFLSPGINAVVYDGTLDHQTDPNYLVTLVPLRISVELGLEVDIVNTCLPKLPIKRAFFRWSPFYYNTPDFAVDYNWPGVDWSAIPKSANVIGRWYVGGSW